MFYRHWAEKIRVTCLVPFDRFDGSKKKEKKKERTEKSLACKLGINDSHGFFNIFDTTTSREIVQCSLMLIIYAKSCLRGKTIQGTRYHHRNAALSPYLVTSNFILEQFSTRSLVTNDANVFAKRTKEETNKGRGQREKLLHRNSTREHFLGIRGLLLILVICSYRCVLFNSSETLIPLSSKEKRRKKKEKIVRVRSLRNFSLSARVDRCDTRYIGVFLDRSRNETRNGTYSVRYSRLEYWRRRSSRNFLERACDCNI